MGVRRAAQAATAINVLDIKKERHRQTHTHNTVIVISRQGERNPTFYTFSQNCQAGLPSVYLRLDSTSKLQCTILQIPDLSPAQ